MSSPRSNTDEPQGCCSCSDRVLKAILVSAPACPEALRPLALLLTSEDPPSIVLRLNNKDPITTHDDMINLSRRPVNGRQHDIVNNLIHVIRQRAQPPGDNCLADVATNRRTRRFQQGLNNPQLSRRRVSSPLTVGRRRSWLGLGRDR